MLVLFFFFNDAATTEISTLPLHDALPISTSAGGAARRYTRYTRYTPGRCAARAAADARGDRKSTRLNSSHLVISYAVFCLKKKNPTGLFDMYRRGFRQCAVHQSRATLPVA